MTPKTNFKQLINPLYLGSYSLDNGDGTYKTLDATVKYCKGSAVVGPDGKESSKILAYTDQPKPFILNAESMGIVQQFCKSRYAEDWVNIPITFYVLENKKYFGKILDVLRIRIRQVGVKSDYTKQIELLTSSQTIEELQKNYTSLTTEQKNATVAIKDEMKSKLTLTPTQPELI
jgi:hypothetical protein